MAFCFTAIHEFLDSRRLEPAEALICILLLFSVLF